MTEPLTTARLILRPLEAADLDRVVALANNWKVASMLGRMPYPYRRAEAEAFLSGVAADRDEGALALIRPEGVIGMVGLHRQEARAHELGYWLGEPYWGFGYAREAAGALLTHGFDRLGLPYATAGHFLDNPASGRVLQTLGFRYIGQSERDCRARGAKVPCHEMILERTDWNTQ